jgi:putative hydrolase of HD superfamily
MSTVEVRALVRYLYEIGHLKHSKRTGWWLAGVKDPESIAEHSFRTAVIGYILALMEGANPSSTAALCLFHDSLETRIGDIPSSSKRYVPHIDTNAIAADQVHDFPASIHDSIVGLLDEYQAQQSHEARLAKDADRLECLMQAREYEEQGYRKAQEWTVNNAAKLQSDAAKRLAEVCLEAPPARWWDSIVRETGSSTDGHRSAP